MRVLRAGGRIVSLGLAAASGMSKPVALRELLGASRLHPIKLLETSRGFIGVNILRIFEHRPELGALLLRQAFDLAASGKVKPVIAAEIPLEKAWEAHRLLEGRTTIGKVLLSVRG